MKNRKKKFAVLLNGDFLMNTVAVSYEKAINNVRYRMYLNEGTWFNIPRVEEFDAVEV